MRVCGWWVWSGPGDVFCTRTVYKSLLETGCGCGLGLVRGVANGCSLSLGAGMSTGCALYQDCGQVCVKLHTLVLCSVAGSAL